MSPGLCKVRILNYGNVFEYLFKCKLKEIVSLNDMTRKSMFDLHIAPSDLIEIR